MISVIYLHVMMGSGFFLGFKMLPIPSFPMESLKRNVRIVELPGELERKFFITTTLWKIVNPMVFHGKVTCKSFMIWMKMSAWRIITLGCMDSA